MPFTQYGLAKLSHIRPTTVHLPTGFVRELASTRSQQALFSAIIEWMPRVIGAQRVSVGVPHGPDHLRLCSEPECSALPDGAVLPIATSFAGQAFRTQQVVELPVIGDSEAEEVEQLEAAGMQAALIAPMVSGEVCLGTINVANKAQHYFTRTDAQMLRSIADLTAAFLSVHQLADGAHERSKRDALTGLFNRSAVLAHLEICFETSRDSLAILHLDIDGFKTINDNHGHDCGDEMLQRLTERMQTVLAGDEILGRLGNDEFLIIVTDPHTDDALVEMAERLVAVCCAPITIRYIEIEPSVRVGIARADATTTSARDLLADADRAVHAAKTSHNAVQISNPMVRSQAALVSGIDQDLDIAMMSRAIVFNYQPICDMATSELMGLEALVRWHHKALGDLPASLITSRVWATGRTDTFTRWSLETITREFAAMRRRNRGFSGRVGINLTPRQLTWPGLLDCFLGAIEQVNLSPSDIIIEVVESAEITPGDACEITLNRLAESGAPIALDDFGTGHNALGYFTMFPIHAIKFDQSLVQAMPSSIAARSIVASLTLMADDLNVTPIAEGIETHEQAQLCAERGISLGQGWLYGRAHPISAFTNTTGFSPDNDSAAMSDEASLPQGSN